MQWNIQKLFQSSFLNIHIWLITFKSYQINIFVSLQTDGPKFYLRSTKWVKEGNNISIETGTIGNPPPVMSWRKNGNDSILSSDKTLSLASVTRKQAGIYTFQATCHRLRKNNLTEEFSKNATVALEVKCR